MGCDIPKTFDKLSWNTKEDPAFPPSSRTLMLDDLLASHQLKGLHYRQLMDSLSAPDAHEADTLAYFIIEDYGSDIDPVYTKSLHVYINKDSVVTGYKVKEWKKQGTK